MPGDVPELGGEILVDVKNVHTVSRFRGEIIGCQMIIGSPGSPIRGGFTGFSVACGKICARLLKRARGQTIKSE